MGALYIYMGGYLSGHPGDMSDICLLLDKMCDGCVLNMGVLYIVECYLVWCAAYRRVCT